MQCKTVLVSEKNNAVTCTMNSSVSAQKGVFFPYEAQERALFRLSPGVSCFLTCQLNRSYGYFTLTFLAADQYETYLTPFLMTYV